MSAKEVRFSTDARDKMLREVASKTSNVAGDGTTTATVIAPFRRTSRGWPPGRGTVP